MSHDVRAKCSLKMIANLSTQTHAHTKKYAFLQEGIVHRNTFGLRGSLLPQRCRTFENAFMGGRNYVRVLGQSCAFGTLDGYEVM